MAARIKYTREVLEAAVASSLSMREALKKAGAKNLAGSTRTLVHIEAAAFLRNKHGSFRGSKMEPRYHADGIQKTSKQDSAVPSR